MAAYLESPKLVTFDSIMCLVEVQIMLNTQVLRLKLVLSVSFQRFPGRN